MATKISITGMTCGHCVSSVEKALAAVPGVTKVIEVSKDRGEAIIDGAAESAALLAAVAEEGYEAKIVE